jgi:hypothetical protein
VHSVNSNPFFLVILFSIFLFSLSFYWRGAFFSALWCVAKDSPSSLEKKMDGVGGQVTVNRFLHRSQRLKSTFSNGGNGSRLFLLVVAFGPSRLLWRDA